MSNSLQPHGLLLASLLSTWNSSGKNIGVGCHSFPQRIFLSQGSNPGLLHCRQILYCLSHQEALSWENIDMQMIEIHVIIDITLNVFSFVF